VNSGRDEFRSIFTISTKSFHDLTHLLHKDMSVYPGEPEPEFDPIFMLGTDKVNVTKLTIGSHTGTHVDAPKHFISNGKSIDNVCLDRYIGEAIILDMSKKKAGRGINDYDLDKQREEIRAGDILLLYSGTSNSWNRDSTRKNFAYLEPSAAKWIVDHKIKCVGIDSYSVEKYGFTEGWTHKTLLSKGIGIIEGLNSNLKKFLRKRMFLVCLPLLLKGIDGSPARAVLFDICKK